MLVFMLSSLYAVSVALFVVMALRIGRTFRQAKAPRIGAPLRDDVDLPSVTVCIPARNEQHALTECLERVVASTYEKLEIIVLDDDSVDNTSILIKSFAHAGVRFVAGGDLPGGWLGKNYALKRLLEESSGSYVLFMDVDTRISPMAIENAVRYALSERASMVSVLPRREDGFRMSIVASPLRYFWEVLFHREAAPAAASGAWLVNRRTLEAKAGGLEEYALATQPESKLAAHFAETNEYRFVISSQDFGFSFEKKWSSQVETSIRLLYPLLASQPGLIAVAFLDMLILVAPFILTILFFALGLTAWAVPALCVHLLFAGLYGAYAHRVWAKGWFFGALLWPCLLLQEAVLLFVSAVRYRRKTVTWKGRRIQPEKTSL